MSQTTHRQVSPEVVETVAGWVRTATSASARLEELWTDAHWRGAVWALQVHGLAPLLGHRREQGQLEVGLSSVVHDYVATELARNRERVGILREELRSLLRESRRRGLDTLPLKGSVLVEHYYPEPGIRPMADIDLLVPPDQEQRWVALLGEMGYASTGRTLKHRTFLLERLYQGVVFTQGEHPKNPYMLDLHTAVREEVWGLRYPLTRGLWQGSTMGSYGSEPGLVPSPGSLLEHLLVHACYDMRVGKLRLIQLYDIRTVAARVGEPEWLAMVERAAIRDQMRMLWAPLTLVHRYLGPAAPALVLEELRRGTPQSVRSLVAESNAHRVSYCNSLPLPLRDKLRWYRPGWERLRGLRALFLPSPRELRDRFPTLARARDWPGAYGRTILQGARWFWGRWRGHSRQAWPYSEEPSNDR